VSARIIPPNLPGRSGFPAGQTIRSLARVPQRQPGRKCLAAYDKLLMRGSAAWRANNIDNCSIHLPTSRPRYRGRRECTHDGVVVTLQSNQAGAKRAYLAIGGRLIRNEVVQPAAQAGAGAMLKANRKTAELDLSDCLHGYGKALLLCRDPAMAPRRRASALSTVS
jgi:hypothetical protein